ncbi:uncharacterized protein LOC133873308 [Alnus glutinosa]|uniref:uncharacterized protein LOC133873308 n=1 Tax=Alnus glutinosa TaxID=3517 RepID=UPI002D774F53|nr:uncharacterized protein LOC133873308 [Alnus glutinosa]
MELEHRAYWAIKQLNFNLTKAGSLRKLQLNELEEMRNDAYDWKLRSQWTGRFIVHSVFFYGTIEIEDPKNGSTFKFENQVLNPSSYDPLSQKSSLEDTLKEFMEITGQSTIQVLQPE